jgi:DNA-directed RNA polymerase specialized sigma24 family protein
MVLKEMNPRYYKRYCSYTVIDTFRVASGHRIRTQGKNCIGRALKNTLTNTDIPVFDAFVEECRIYKELEREDWEQAIRYCQMLTEREKEVFVLYLCANRNLRHIGMIMQISEARVCQILKGRSELVFDYLKRTGHLQHA